MAMFRNSLPVLEIYNSRYIIYYTVLYNLCYYIILLYYNISYYYIIFLLVVINFKIRLINVICIFSMTVLYKVVSIQQLMNRSFYEIIHIICVTFQLVKYIIYVGKYIQDVPKVWKWSNIS